MALNGTTYIPGNFPIGVERQTIKSLSTDAWAKLKVSHDESILHGMFTFNVPVTKWKESIDSVEQVAFSNAVSLNGKLVLSSGTYGKKVKLDSFRNPRYEPNRGHLYATSIFLPNPGFLGQRTFGVFTEQSGVALRLRNGVMYSVIRTTVGGVTSDDEVEITTPIGFDATKGNTFDIQFQWRGVGNYHFFINQKIVQEREILGTLDELSMFNPAAPIAFECIDLGDTVSISCGCVDVSSEGGKDNGKTYGSVFMGNLTGSVLVSGFNTPIIAIRNKSLIGGLINTRDVLALLATAYADQRCIFRVWITRDDTAVTLNDQIWSDFGDGHIEYVTYGLNQDGSALAGVPIAFTLAKATGQFGCRVDQDQSYSTSALFEGRTDIYLTPGDTTIFTMHRETGGNANVGVTFEFAEAI